MCERSRAHERETEPNARPFARELVPQAHEGLENALALRAWHAIAAVDHMHAHASKPITVQHIADAVHISTRGLHAAFVSETGRSPSEHLRAIRLEGVRAELRFAEPTESIAAIARRWGFVHLSRFAEAYERAFGELPSATRATRSTRRRAA